MEKLSTKMSELDGRRKSSYCESIHAVVAIIDVRKSGETKCSILSKDEDHDFPLPLGTKSSGATVYFGDGVTSFFFFSSRPIVGDEAKFTRPRFFHRSIRRGGGGPRRVSFDVQDK